MFFSESDEIGRCLGLQVLEFHFPHWGFTSLEALPAKIENKKLAPFDFGERSQVWGDEVVVGKGPEPDAATGPNTREPERDCIRLRSVGCHQDKLSAGLTQEGRHM
jgi:hypothetical protein